MNVAESDSESSDEEEDIEDITDIEELKRILEKDTSSHERALTRKEAVERSASAAKETIITLLAQVWCVEEQ